MNCQSRVKFGLLNPTKNATARRNGTERACHVTLLRVRVRSSGIYFLDILINRRGQWIAADSLHILLKKAGKMINCSVVVSGLYNWTSYVHICDDPL